MLSGLTGLLIYIAFNCLFVIVGLNCWQILFPRSVNFPTDSALNECQRNDTFLISEICSDDLDLTTIKEVPFEVPSRTNEKLKLHAQNSTPIICVNHFQ